MELITTESEVLKTHPELKAYLPFMANIQQWAKVADAVKEAHEKGEDAAAEARKVRLAVAKERNALDKERKELKAAALAYSKAVDGTAKPAKDFASAIESDMKAIEQAAEIAAAKERAELEATRLDQLRQAGCPTPEIFRGLADMDVFAFEALLEGERQKAELMAAEAARIEEAKRLEAERQAAEMSRLKEEAEAARRLEAARQEKQRQIDALNRQRYAELAALEAGADFSAKENKAPYQFSAAEWQNLIEFYQQRHADLMAEREKQRLAAERAAKLAAEQAAAEKAAAEEAARLAAAPDKEKLRQWAKDFGLMGMPSCDTEHGRKVVAGLEEMRKKMLAWLANELNK